MVVLDSYSIQSLHKRHNGKRPQNKGDYIPRRQLIDYWREQGHSDADIEKMLADVVRHREPPPGFARPFIAARQLGAPRALLSLWVDRKKVDAVFYPNSNRVRFVRLEDVARCVEQMKRWKQEHPRKSHE